MMYYYISGELVEKSQDSLIIDNAGIAYRIFVSSNSLRSHVSAGDSLKLYIHHHHKEDCEKLFGFLTKGEREVFEALIGVSNIGPGKAMAILSSISAEDFLKAVMAEDILLLSSVKGLGKKTAERLILELREKIKDMSYSEDYPENAAGGYIPDALSGLIALGFREMQAREMINRAMSDIGPDDMPEDIIRKALKNHA